VKKTQQTTAKSVSKTVASDKAGADQPKAVKGVVNAGTGTRLAPLSMARSKGPVQFNGVRGGANNAGSTQLISLSIARGASNIRAGGGKCFFPDPDTGDCLDLTDFGSGSSENDPLRAANVLGSLRGQSQLGDEGIISIMPGTFYSPPIWQSQDEEGGVFIPVPGDEYLFGWGAQQYERCSKVWCERGLGNMGVCIRGTWHICPYDRCYDWYDNEFCYNVPNYDACSNTRARCTRPSPN
jgi:hypothetical protein